MACDKHKGKGYKDGGKVRMVKDYNPRTAGSMPVYGRPTKSEREANARTGQDTASQYKPPKPISKPAGTRTKPKMEASTPKVQTAKTDNVKAQNTTKDVSSNWARDAAVAGALAYGGKKVYDKVKSARTPKLPPPPKQLPAPGKAASEQKLSMKEQAAKKSTQPKPTPKKTSAADKLKSKGQKFKKGAYEKTGKALKGLADMTGKATDTLRSGKNIKRLKTASKVSKATRITPVGLAAGVLLDQAIDVGVKKNRQRKARKKLEKAAKGQGSGKPIQAKAPEQKKKTKKKSNPKQGELFD